MDGKFGKNQWKIGLFYAVSVILMMLVLVIAGRTASAAIKIRYDAYQKAQVEQEKIREKEAAEAELLAKEQEAAQLAEEEAARKAEEKAAKKVAEKAKKEAEEEAAKKAAEEKTYVSQYELVVSDATWKQAKQAAKDRGGHLAVITSEEEQRIVEELIDRNDHIHTVWLGGYRKNDTFQWINKEKFEYSKWGSGEPNNQTGDEKYLDMYESKDVWYWNDVPNSIHEYYSGKMGYVIEWEVEQ